MVIKYCVPLIQCQNPFSADAEGFAADLSHFLEKIIMVKPLLILDTEPFFVKGKLAFSMIRCVKYV